MPRHWTGLRRPTEDKAIRRAERNLSKRERDLRLLDEVMPLIDDEEMRKEREGMRNLLRALLLPDDLERR